MTSLLDQYEEAEQRAANFANVTGFSGTNLEEDKPIFNKQRINFKPPEQITHLVVSNKILILSMTNKILLRIDLSCPDNPDEIDVGRHLGDKSEGTEVKNLFQDPYGHHLIICLAGRHGQTETVYLSRNSRKLRSTSKTKSHSITAVGWNNYCSDALSTGPILVGTSKGLVFETQINTGDERHIFQTHAEQFWKQAFDIGKDHEMQITGIEFHRMTNLETKYFVLVTTPNRLYQFIGQVTSNAESPVLYHIFSNYVDTMEKYLDIPSHLSYSTLAVWSRKSANTPLTFAWMTGAGVMLGNIDCTGQAGVETVLTDNKLLPLPKSKDGQIMVPLLIVLTEFHVLILFKDRVKSYCILDMQLVYEDIFTETFGPPVGITKDPSDGVIWIYQVHAVYKYKLHRESRNVWKIYLEKGNFALAKQHAQDNLSNLDQVRQKEADHLFNNGDYIESAKHYAMCEATLEEISLKFIQVDEKEALKFYLIHKLNSLGANEKTQITLLSLWVMEIFLTTLGKLKDSNLKNSPKFYSYRAELLKFIDIPKVRDSINNNRTAVYELISSHGDEDALVAVAKLMRDSEQVIRHHIQQGNATAAIEMLQNQNDAGLIYKFCPSLMQVSPRETVNLMISKGRLLSPTDVIPALVQCNTHTNQKQALEAIRYLEFCLSKLENKDCSVHNYLLSLYVEHKPESLMAYLTAQGQDAYSVCYDLDFALRVCSERGLDHACINIYTTMGLYEEAVDLALKVDLELAKENSNKPVNNNELKKKLWLKIARHVVKEENDIKKAMEFLQECDLLKIEDVLPFFPDFVTIDHFKDAICQSLQEYNEHIVVLKQEMDQATQSAQEIHSEIVNLKQKCNFVRADDKCSLCQFPTLMRGFYAFPCGHMFHIDCLTAEIMTHLTGAKKQRVRELQQLIAAPSVAKDDAAYAKERYEAELEEMIASDCLYCGDLMIRSVDVPLISPSEYSEAMKGWD